MMRRFKRRRKWACGPGWDFDIWVRLRVGFRGETGTGPVPCALITPHVAHAQPPAAKPEAEVVGLDVEFDRCVACELHGRRWSLPGHMQPCHCRPDR